MADNNAKHREQLIRSVLTSVEQLNDRNFTNYLNGFASDFTMHVPIVPQPFGRQEALQFAKDFPDIFPGVHLDVDQIFTSPSGDALVYRFTATADGTNGFLDLPATHGPIRFSGSTFTISKAI